MPAVAARWVGVGGAEVADPPDDGVALTWPEGLLDPLTDQELRDLFAYLRSEPGRKAP